MKLLFDHSSPFLLAHGGAQIQIEQTKKALEAVGVEVEYLRWWDEHQRGDIIHYFGRPWPSYVRMAKEKGIRVVLADLLGGLGARASSARAVQKVIKTAAEKLLGSEMILRLGWESFRLVDACITLTSWEGQLLREMFDVPAHRVHCVPNGVEDIFFQKHETKRGPWLVCTATLTAIKRTLELAEAAVAAERPIWLIGRPFAQGDPYAERCLRLARKHPKFIRYEGPIQDRAVMAEAYRQARGFVLLSTFESLSLSALEAAACGCPLLLSDLPWARCTFGDKATYCPIGAKSRTAAILRRFYDEAPRLPTPPRPLSWREVGEKFRELYRQLLKGGS
jgi:glycosyltransferase involved in cell wall biosynthesis